MYEINTKIVIDEIKKNNAKRVMLQLPFGLRPRGKEVVDQIRKETG